MLKLIFSCVCLLFMVACLAAETNQGQQGTVYIGDKNDLAGIEAHLKRLYQIARQDQEVPATCTEMTIVDAQLLYKYSPSKGVQPVELVIPDPDGRVIFSDGSEMQLPPPEPIIWRSQPGSATNGGFGPVLTQIIRKIESKNGYWKADGYVQLPSTANLSGVDGVDSDGRTTDGGGNPRDEGAFNYLGIRTSSRDAEFGLAYNKHTSYGGWKFYRSIYTTSLDWAIVDGNLGYVPAGSNVFLKAWTTGTDNNNGQFHIYGTWDEGYLVEHYYNVPGFKADGAGQKIRRMSTMVLWSSGKSIGNHWTNVYIADTTDRHHWTRNSDTDAAVEDPDDYVTCTTAHADYDETVNLQR
ncbi:MAG: hypothetical protein BWY76_01136 [bacterium ADurb.Bin429]|nr:MAG: hypothetical protein BWY76_01136 [bacterium ADurb.Bin429]